MYTFSFTFSSHMLSLLDFIKCLIIRYNETLFLFPYKNKAKRKSVGCRFPQPEAKPEYMQHESR